MNSVSHQQLDDVQDAIDMVGLIESAVVIYPSVSQTAGVAMSATDVIGEIACDRHPNEAVAKFRENPAEFLKSGSMVDIGPISAASFAIMISALDAVASAGHALDELNGKRL